MCFPNSELCLVKFYVFPQDRVNGFRFKEQNDAIVGLTSQQDEILTTGPSFDDVHFHIAPWGLTLTTGVTGDPLVASSAFTLLDGPVSLFTEAFPASGSTGAGNPWSVNGLNPATDASDYSKQCGSGGPMNAGSSSSAENRATVIPTATGATAPDSRVQILSPSAGQQFAPGESVTLTIQVASSFPAVAVLLTLEGVGQVPATSTGNGKFQATETLPDSFAGPLVITPLAIDSGDNAIAGPSVTASVKPSTAPQSVAFASKYFYVSPSDVPSQQLYLTGQFSGGNQLDLTTAVTGTTYNSSNNSVVTVTADGLATIKGQGLAVVTAQNGPAKDFAIFVVQNPAAPLPPQVLTSQFTIQQGGFVLNRNTGFFVQTVTLTNSSGLPAIGPLYAVFSGLPAGVTLVNSSGTTQQFATGSPYLSIPLSPDGRTIPSGQRVTLSLQFLDSGRASISYSMSLVNSSIAP